MSKQSHSNPRNSLFAPLGIGFFIGALTVGTAVLVWKHDRGPHRSSTPAASETSATPTAPAVFNSASLPALDLVVSRVAAWFACSCGSCGEERLDVCSCPTAQQERAFIQELLRNGRSEAEAAEALNQKYGGLKS